MEKLSFENGENIESLDQFANAEEEVIKVIKEKIKEAAGDPEKVERLNQAGQALTFATAKVVRGEMLDAINKSK